MKKLAILVSGAGSTLANLCAHVARGDLQAEIGMVVSNNHKAEQVIREWKLQDVWFPIADNLNDQIFRLCEGFGIHLVVMAGWNKLLVIPEGFKGRVLNIHPTLLPKYGGKGMYGLRPHEAVLAAGEKETGCTVHVADNEYDHGPILAQESVPVMEGDTALLLQKRVQEAERRLYPRVIQEYLQGTTVAGSGF